MQLQKTFNTILRWIKRKASNSQNNFQNEQVQEVFELKNEIHYQNCKIMSSLSG